MATDKPTALSAQIIGRRDLRWGLTGFASKVPRLSNPIEPILFGLPLAGLGSPPVNAIIGIIILWGYLSSRTFSARVAVLLSAANNGMNQS